MTPSQSISKNALRAIVVMVVTLLLVAIYANVQKARRDKIEKATFTPAASSTASPTASPPAAR